LTQCKFHVILYHVKYPRGFVETGPGEGRLRLPGRGTRSVCTVSRACRLLRRSRRQVYRYLRSGDLVAAGKLLGEWLVERKSVDRLARSPLTVHPVPSHLQPLLPEHRVGSLNAGRDRVLIVSRVLELGGVEQVRWVLRRYPRREIARIVRDDGARLLSPRSLRLWSLIFAVQPAALPQWRDPSAWLSR